MDRFIFQQSLFFGLMNVTEDSDMKLIKPMCCNSTGEFIPLIVKVSEDDVNVRERRD